MPRQRRVEYAGAMYHVMSRGDRKEDIYLDDVFGHFQSANERLHAWMRGEQKSTPKRKRG